MKIKPFSNSIPFILQIAFFCLAMKPVPAHSQGAGAAFIKIDPSPRSYSLGQASALTSLGAQAVTSNPANLTEMAGSKFQLFSAFSTLSMDSQYGHAAVSLNRSQEKKNFIDAAGFGITYTNIADMDSRDSSGNKTGASFGASDKAMSFSVAHRSLGNMRIGMTGKILSSQIAGHRSNNAIAGDFGVQYTFSKLPNKRHPLSLGASLNNFGQKIGFISQNDPLPMGANLGLSMPFGPATALVGINQMLTESRTVMGFGFEYGLGVLSLRAGYKSGSDSKSNLALQNQNGVTRMLQSITAGMGINIGNFSLDYAVGNDAVELGTNHRIAFSFHWGAKKEQDTRAQNGVTRLASQRGDQ